MSYYPPEDEGPNDVAWIITIVAVAAAVIMLLWTS